MTFGLAKRSRWDQNENVALMNQKGVTLWTGAWPTELYSGFTCPSQNHRMAWVRRDLKDHVVPTPCRGQEHLSLGKIAHNHIQVASNGARDGASTTSPQPVPVRQ